STRLRLEHGLAESVAGLGRDEQVGARVDPRQLLVAGRVEQRDRVAERGAESVAGALAADQDELEPRIAFACGEERLRDEPQVAGVVDRSRAEHVEWSAVGAGR